MAVHLNVLILFSLNFKRDKLDYSATTIQKGYGHSQTVLKVVHYGFQAGEGENWYQSKWKLPKRKTKNDFFRDTEPHRAKDFY